MRYLIIVFILILTSCSRWKEGNYRVQEDEFSECQNLVFDISDRLNSMRVECIQKIGSNNNFIVILDIDANYWFIDKSKDNKYFNSNEIVEGPFLKAEYLKMDRFKDIILADV